MSGRAVGGGAAIGCGAFTFVGLLLGVGLTVFLGSRATDSLGGSGDSGLKDLKTKASVLASQPVPGTTPTKGRITLTMPATLADGGKVGVAGHDLAPGPIELTECLTSREPYPPDGGGQCDLTTTTSGGTVTGRGELAGTYAVRRVITVQGTRYDCAARVGGCTLVAHPKGRLDSSATGPLAFAQGLAPVEAQAPPIS
ncbi:MAG: hypothetical protein U0P45_00535 [Acidimicrobiales bacterium]